MNDRNYPIKTFGELRMYIAADMFRYMTSTSLRACKRAESLAFLREALCEAIK